MDKAPDAFRTISEVADDLDLPQHVLRFWETRFQQIKPMKRGGGRRYYRPDDIDLLRGIRHLLYGEGYTIRGVQRILKDHGIRFVQNVWKAGAPQPPPTAADAVDGDIGEPSLARPLPGSRRAEEGERRRLFGLLPGLAVGQTAPEARSETEPSESTPAMPVEPMERRTVAGPAAPGGVSISAENLLKLQATLQELGECRRLLDAALEEP